MEELLNQILDNSRLPALTAFVLGLLTAISPCPLATNITAVAYISKQIENRKMMFLRGMLYTLGRTLAYSTLGAILICIIRRGEEVFGIQQAVSHWGEVLLGPVLVFMGLFMLFGHYLHLPGLSIAGHTDERMFKGNLEVLLLGILFAMAFCPTSGLFFFGILIPLSASESTGYLLPVIFSIATSIPVLAVSWILTFSIQNLSRFISNIQVFQKWFNRLVAFIFLGVGVYYTITIYA